MFKPTTLHVHPLVSSRVYIVGSLRNPEIPVLGNKIRELGYVVFDDWFAAGPEADDKWRDYELAKGTSTMEAALNGHAAKHVFEFDYSHLAAADIVVLLLPAGKSGHMELAWAQGRGKKCHVVYSEEPERWDVMYQLIPNRHYSIDALLKALTIG